MKKLIMTIALASLPGIIFANEHCADWQKHEVTKLNSSEQVNLCDVMGSKPVLLVNTASHCGFTYQFKGLEALYKKYKDQGLVIIGFPSNDFNQEAAEEAKTAEICFKNYGVTFLMSQPVAVKGPDAHPLFQHLASETDAPNWNFNKYLVDQSGEVVERFSGNTSPKSFSLKSAIESIL